ncbi:MAG TPA: phage baseplate assembly protein V [Candidatus Binatia bacterium]|nr:phage baseplate assembly protein V [Candidatus Binatia bacterium]
METKETLDSVVAWVRSHYFGKYRGTVSDTGDSTSRGRLKVKVPALLGDLEVWAMPCTPYAGDGVGFYSLPPSGSGVWIEFEGGDPSYPIWSGCFWADGQLPDQSDENIKIWRTKNTTLRCDDGADEVAISDSSGSKLTLGASDAKLEHGESSVDCSDSSVTVDSNGSEHVVGVEGVNSQSADGAGVDITAVVSINDGAFEVA